MIFTISCDKSQHAEPKTNFDHLLIKSLPIFPIPSIDVINELEEVCPEDKCMALHEWLGRLIILDKQLTLYQNGFNE